MYFSELAGATRLLFVSIIGSGSFGDGFPVGNARFLELDHQLFIVFDAPFEGTQVEFSLSRYDRLFQFFRLFDDPCRVFFVHAYQNLVQFFCIGLVGGFYGALYFRIGEFHQVEYVFATFLVQRITGAHIFQFYGCADISGDEFVDFVTYLSAYATQLGNTFFAASVHILEVVSLVYFSRHNLEVRNFSDMRFDGRFEEIKAGRAVGVGSNLCAVVGDGFGHVGNKRNHISEKFHHAAHTHVA